MPSNSSQCSHLLLSLNKLISSSRMTFNIRLPSVLLDLLESLVSCLEITLMCFDFLGFLAAAVKIFSAFSMSAL